MQTNQHAGQKTSALHVLSHSDAYLSWILAARTHWGTWNFAWIMPTLFFFSFERKRRVILTFPNRKNSRFCACTLHMQSAKQRFIVPSVFRQLATIIQKNTLHLFFVTILERYTRSYKWQYLKKLKL